MSADFKSIITTAKQEHEESYSTREEQDAEGLAAAETMIAAGVALLKKRVSPLLVKAGKAFAAENVECEIVEEFDVAPQLNRQPSLTIKCVGPERTNRHGGISQPRSIPVFFKSDGETFSIGLESYDGSKSPDDEAEVVANEQVEEAVAEAIKLVATSYYDSLGKLRQSGLWD